jgi:hypothetical protein
LQAAYTAKKRVIDARLSLGIRASRGPSIAMHSSACKSGKRGIPSVERRNVRNSATSQRRGARARGGVAAVAALRGRVGAAMVAYGAALGEGPRYSWTRVYVLPAGSQIRYRVTAVDVVSTGYPNLRAFAWAYARDLLSVPWTQSIAAKMLRASTCSRANSLRRW